MSWPKGEKQFCKFCKCVQATEIWDDEIKCSTCGRVIYVQHSLTF